jgi:hypothetical protein
MIDTIKIWLFFIFCAWLVYKLLMMEYYPSPARKRRLFNSRQKSRGYQ